MERHENQIRRIDRICFARQRIGESQRFAVRSAVALPDRDLLLLRLVAEGKRTELNDSMGGNP